MEPAGLDELLDRARRRDPEALARLVELYSPRVFGLLHRLTGTRDVAEDLLQETFLRVVRTIGEYEHVGRFESWLFRIAANLARDRARRIERRGETGWIDPWLDEVPGALRPHAIGESPSVRLERDEAGRRLEMALDKLSAAEREILVLRHYSELPFQEIASLLQIPLGTALARAHRALQHVRELMAEPDGG